MFLVELVLQGVRGIRELARLRFQGGFNFVAAGNESGKTTAVDAMERLLFPSSQAGLMEALISRHTPDASRSALVVFTDDNAYYRIIEDFSKKGVNLSKYNPASKDFSLLHKDWDSAVQFMAGITTGISEQDFVKIFVFRRDQYVNQSGTSSPSPEPMAMPQHAVRSAPAASSGGKAKASQSRLAELREVLRKAEEAADAEYKAQSAKLALDEIKKKMLTLDEIEEKRAESEAVLAELKACATLPENLSELIDAHERRLGQKIAEVDERNKALGGFKMQMEGIPQVNLIADKLFLTGAALGIIFILAGVFVFTAEQAIYFPIGVLMSLGLIATAWYNGSRKNAQRKAIMQDAEALEKDVADIEKRFEQEGASIKTCMQATGAATPGELKEKAFNYRHFVSQRDEIEEHRQRILGEASPEALQEQYNKQQQEALELEKAARAVAQDNVDTYSIRQDIERIEGEAAPEAAWNFSAEIQGLPTDFAPPLSGSRQIGFHDELGVASRIGGIEMNTLIPAVEAAAQRNLSTITNGRYVRIEVGQDGGAPVVHAKDDSVVSYGELSHGTRDLIYFCLRTGLVEALVGKRRLPFVLDDPLSGFDPARQKSACQILRSLGTKTQVILFSSNPALRAEGDVAAELK